MKRGFSLVELSIVLVILGLLVGGVLSGQSLIRAAELRSVSTDLSKINTAFYTFRDKYFALPGDMSNATQFWGAAHATPATCRTTSSATAATCDGNGDGLIVTLDGGTTYSEHFHTWKQLANAGLVEGNYTGVACAGGALCSSAGTNVPRVKIGNAAISVTNVSPITSTSDPTWFASSYGNLLFYGGTTAASEPKQNILRPEELWNIDTKLDDGIPNMGRVMAQKADSPNCFITAGAAYNLSNTTQACYVLYLLKI